MKYTLPVTALLVAASSVPDAIQAWSCGGGPSSFYSLSIPLILQQSPASRMMRRGEARMNRAFARSRWSSPRYEITDTDEKFELAVDVPGVPLENLDITLDDGVLIVRGQRETSDSNYSFTSKFSQSFALDPSVDVEKFTANLKNGVLIISAPKDLKRIEENIRRIPITKMATTTTTPSDVEDTQQQVMEEKESAQPTMTTTTAPPTDTTTTTPAPSETTSKEDSTVAAVVDPKDEVAPTESKASDDTDGLEMSEEDSV